MQLQTGCVLDWYTFICVALQLLILKWQSPTDTCYLALRASHARHGVVIFPCKLVVTAADGGRTGGAAGRNLVLNSGRQEVSARPSMNSLSKLRRRLTCLAMSPRESSSARRS